MSRTLWICTASLLFASFIKQGSAQNVPCFTGTGCGSGDIGEQATVFDCCSMPNTFTYRPAIGAEACLPCYTFGWVQNITSDLLSGVPQTDITAVEGETITLTLFFAKNNPSNFIIFDFALSTSGSATAGEDYVVTPDADHLTNGFLSLRLDPVTVNVTLLNDGVGGEGSEEIVLTLVQQPPIEEFRVLIKPSVKITLRDNDIQTGFEILSDCIVEGDSEEICLTTVGIPEDDRVLDVHVIYGTAGVEDFNLITTQITITGNNTAPCVRFEAVADSLELEGAENLTVTLTGPPDVQLNIASVNVFIQESNGPTVTMGFAVRSLSTREDGGNISIEVSLLQPVAAPVSVGVDFIPGSAGTDDFVRIGQARLKFTTNGTQGIVVEIVDDNKNEEEEMFSISLINLQSPDCVIISPNLVTVTIIDNDETIIVGFEEANLTVPEDAGSISIPVTIKQQVHKDITVDVLIIDGCAMEKSDFVSSSPSNLTFTSNGTKIILISINDDTEYEPPESFFLSVVSPQSEATVIVIPDTITITITDNDEPPIVKFDPTSYTVMEGVNKFVELLIQVDSDTATNMVLNIKVSLVPDSAEVGSDFLSTPQVAALAPGQREKRVRVSIIDDSTVEETEMFTAILSMGDTSSPAIATVSILDNDSKESELYPLTTAGNLPSCTGANLYTSKPTNSATTPTSLFIADVEITPWPNSATMSSTSEIIITVVIIAVLLFVAIIIVTLLVVIMRKKQRRQTPESGYEILQTARTESHLYQLKKNISLPLQHQLQLSAAQADKSVHL